MQVIVIGGGASGMIAAITAAKAGHEVTILEHKDRIGKKLLATGNGRCNLSNSILMNNPWESYRDYDEGFIKNVFSKFSYKNTIDFFNDLGLVTKKRQTLVYPYSDQASAVLDVLRIKIRELGIKVICDTRVNAVSKNHDIFEIDTNEKKYRADRVIIATGSKAQPKTGSDGSGYDIVKKLGHKIDSVSPGLVQIKCKGDYFKALSGCRIKSKLSLKSGNKTVYEEAGEVQFTNYGISGIVSMNISNRLSKCNDVISIDIDMMEDYKEGELTKLLMSKVKQNKGLKASELLIGIMPKKIADYIIKIVDITYDSPANKISEDKIKKIVSYVKKMNVQVLGTQTFEDAQICLGGVSLNDIKATMESKIVSGLYLCGEIINLHGDCGGFNLQLAWSTGYIAGCLQ